MGKESKIQWTEATWNPWHGCKKVSAGCKFCYMYRDKERYKQDPTVVLRSKRGFDQPLKMGEPSLIFTCSWSDWFIEEADAWRDEAWDIIRRTPQHTYQILTKRPERIADHLPADWGSGYPNVWLGISAENQEMLEARIEYLIDIEAKVKFLSCEPLLGPLQLPVDAADGSGFVDWVIVGGESGNKTGKYLFRECKITWIADIVRQCEATGTPIFVKQLGTFLSDVLELNDRHGGDINEWPLLDIRKHQFPVHAK